MGGDKIYLSDFQNEGGGGERPILDNIQKKEWESSNYCIAHKKEHNCKTKSEFWTEDPQRILTKTVQTRLEHILRLLQQVESSTKNTPTTHCFAL